MTDVTAKASRPFRNPQIPKTPSNHCTIAVAEEAPRAALGLPSRKPFLNLRPTVLRYLMRPVPVVFLRLAFSDQLSVSCQPWCSSSSASSGYRVNLHFRILAAGYPQAAQT
jgi:hypothetical protein